MAAPETAARAAADRSPPLPEPIVPAQAVQAPVYQTVTRVIEVPATEPAAAPVPTVHPYYRDLDPYWPEYRYRRYYGRDDWFPANTLLGAGIGGVIGNQHSRRWRDRGALIGAGYGLLFDLPRWLR